MEQEMQVEREEEQEMMREEKLRESMRRQNMSASKVLFQTQRDDVERNRRMRKLEEKMSKADRLQEQRAQVLKALQQVRQEMSMQEQAFKEKLEKIERTGDFQKLDELDVDGMATQGVSAFLVRASGRIT
ncbi:hypothetical protein BSKO_04708 [Bryopsis sp. KO-2023]|nr:hypothetical protein BSKO_04708 [Bryopsis sp. KO-2023]